jgi:DNA-binding HxlR family transcriptional regulator
MRSAEVYFFEDMIKPKKEKFKNGSFSIDTWETIGRRWTLLILKDLDENNILRFNDFIKHYPKISNAILSQRLDKLRKLGLISKNLSFDDKPLIEYKLTGSGTELIRFFDAFSTWAKNLDKNKNR